MIIRILGEGQFDVDDGHLDRLNELDTCLQVAADAGDADAFTPALRGLIDEVHRLGTPVPQEVLTTSDLVLPAAGAGLNQVRALLGDEGLIPG
jgi:hypothetical protein